jgi:two-component system, LuxR family, response regulator FixJ
MSKDPTIFVVDDDDAARDSLAVLLEAAGYPVEAFESGDRFLEQAGSLPLGCALVDIRMPGIGGLELQEMLKESAIDVPIIFVTGHADVPVAVRAMRAGAIDFIEKPFTEDLVLAAVRRGLEQAFSRRQASAAAASARASIAKLTDREREVFNQLVQGHPNKVIAANLDISPRTVEIHRSRVMDKTGARSLSDLVRLALAANGDGPDR